MFMGGEHPPITLLSCPIVIFNMAACYKLYHTMSLHDSERAGYICTLRFMQYS